MGKFQISDINEYNFSKSNDLSIFLKNDAVFELLDILILFCLFHPLPFLYSLSMKVQVSSKDCKGRVRDGIRKPVTTISGK
jgi:hypothetical protein